jgi:glycerol-3-phosphate dehydrogenase
MDERRVLDADVVIVGAGVIGTAIAARLSMKKLVVCVIERHHDVAEETSKSNTGLMDSGWECEPGTLEADLVTRSSPQWEDISERLDVPFKRCGQLSIARTKEEDATIDACLASAKRNGVAAERIDAERLRSLAPYVSSDARGGILLPAEGIIDPIRLTLGYAELAARNGASFHFGEPLLAAKLRNGSAVALTTPRLQFRPRFVVNAAGLGADGVSRVLGAEEFKIWPRRGEYLLIDREAGRTINRAITQLPNEHTRGIMVVPTTHGSVLLGPTADDDTDKADRSTHAEKLDFVLRQARGLVPDLRAEHVIKSFTGLRPASERTYRIEFSDVVENLLHVCGIRSTGVSASPGVAEYVEERLTDAGLDAAPRKGARRELPRRRRLAEGATPEEMAEEPLGRTVVCACEKVTAREIHDAFALKLAPSSISGVAKRTRATWGRCQGAACLSGVSFIASLYMSGPAWSLPVGEPGATLGVAETDA